MPHAITAEELFQDLKQMPETERQKFFVLLAKKAFQEKDLSHDELFGHLSGDYFTAEEACGYLEISMSTFRRCVNDGRLQASSAIGRSQLFAVSDLKRFKKARKAVKNTASRQVA
ncbi:helix-turn-helix domain-containing protein [Alcaligenes sp. WGS1538]|uniref:helix-turn-helix domain-containing protein n=1 Tax=Alcaligenes sp. WGS1538 TaxID=3366811 RepID=UPI00229EE244|nr:helix-turn-helix domain-containing protein [Escherichia coli]